MRRFFVSSLPTEGVCCLDGREAHHISAVLRLRAGEHVLLCAGDGSEAEAELVSVEHTQVTARILSRSAGKNETACRITLYQGIPKGDKLEQVCKCCTEIGVSAFVPVSCARSVSKWEEQSARRKCERLGTIAEQACKQCGGSVPPKVHMPLTTAQAALEAGGLRLFAYENEKCISLVEAMKQAVKSGNAREVSLFIGPEGGIDAQEAEMLLRCGWQSVSLGRRILRTENAGFAAAVLILGIAGDLDAAKSADDLHIAEEK